MSDISEAEPVGTRRNPLIWVGVLVVGVILYLVLASDRGRPVVAQDDGNDNAENAGIIDRGLLIPPGMRAREYIAQLREKGRPYTLELVFEKGNGYQKAGSLADAHLLYFFSAREGYLPAMMKMGEMADPMLFQAQESLLDSADSIQAYKWYQKASALGDPAAGKRIRELQDWAYSAALTGNADARQLLLNFQ